MTPASTKLAVIGAGPGGYAAAFFAADLGIDVTLIDPAPNPGGVCLYRGCIPSKALLHAAHLIEAAQHAAALGIDFGQPRIDFVNLRNWKDSVVKRLTDGLGQIARQRKVRYLQGTASIVDPHTVTVETAEGNDQLSFERAILATGSRPARVPGLSLESPRVLDSTSALELTDVPRNLLVIGGGYIGLELGSVYAALGSRVAIVEMTSGLLPGADRDLVTPLARRMERLCKAVLLETKVVSMEEDGAGIAVTLEGAGRHRASPTLRQSVDLRRQTSEFRYPGTGSHQSENRRERVHRSRRAATNRGTVDLCDWRCGWRTDARP